MYFWNTKQLVADLKADRVSNSQLKNYYIGTTLMILTMMALVELGPEGRLDYVFTDWLVNIGLTITWLNLIFKANGGEDGRDFLNRMISISFPISIRVLVFGILIAFVLELLWLPWREQLNEAQAQLWENIVWIIFSMTLTCVGYWRAYVHIKDIATTKAAVL